MKILMVAPEPIFEPRGTPFSVVGRLKALSDMGHSVDLVTYGIGEDVAMPGLRILRIPSIPGIRKIRIGPSIQKIPLDFLLMVYSFYLLMKRSYDILHTHEEAGFWCTAFSRWFGVPHIYDMHSSLPQQLKNFEFTQSGIIKALFDSLENWILKYASAVITICPDLKEYVDALFPERSSVLIENVVDYGMIFRGQNRSNKTIQMPSLKGKRVVLYTGTLEPYQGLDLLIQSARHVVRNHPRVIFVVVGGHPDQVDYYSGQAKSAGMSSHFLFTGQVRPEEVSGYIRRADVLVTPRISGTNTPLKIYAYLRSGVPIVATRILTHTQVLDDRTARLTDTDPKQFADGILKVLSDASYRNSLTKHARALAAAKYSYPGYVQKVRHAMNVALEKGV